ncbi:hypothetical protein ABZX77_30450 [Streptomyces sp. NPDC004237]|uniref:hypothetical protein n=1 Tax=Streptomyces sp. NPDC004237 TaxID=3154455 RepID=UPI0033B19C0D
MVEPMSAAGSSLAKGITSVVTKQLQSKAGMHLGSRDERRQVYQRFQDGVTDVYTVFNWIVMEQRLFTLRFGKERRGFTWRPHAAERAARHNLPQLNVAHAEMFKAYMDLRLVANPAPLEAANAVLDRLTVVLEVDLGVTDTVLSEALMRVVEAQREFTDACRDDLWYLPQRWQLYRPAWWKARRWRRRETSAS